MVFVTKYRRHVFTKTSLEARRAIFERVCADFEAGLVEFDGEDDHVHLLVEYPPKTALSLLFNSSILYDQSSIVSYGDASLTIGTVALVCAPLIFLMRPRKNVPVPAEIAVEG